MRPVLIKFSALKYKRLSLAARRPGKPHFSPLDECSRGSRDSGHSDISGGGQTSTS